MTWGCAVSGGGATTGADETGTGGAVVAVVLVGTAEEVTGGATVVVLPGAVPCPELSQPVSAPTPMIAEAANNSALEAFFNVLIVHLSNRRTLIATSQRFGGPGNGFDDGMCCR